MKERKGNHTMPVSVSVIIIHVEHFSTKYYIEQGLTPTLQGDNMCKAKYQNI